jgi:LytS/YehU family sensor histidine kinase
LKPEVSSFASHGQFSYAYRINQGEWIVLPGNIEQIEIQNMPRGNFNLELKAIDYLGRDSENSIRVYGYVRPPFWQTWWFAALIFVGLLFIVLLIAKKVIANIRKREKEKTALVHSQLTALKAQMNPHFMYNALNSIQALILKQDIKNSNLYLSQFSSLMRLVLEVSEKEEVSLAEETKILNLYLSLEKLRFGTDFHYQIQLADDLDSEQIGLPPLILQPFVENAIKHGLLHKKGEKHLSIDFQIQNEFLQCVIEDNGIGRLHAMEIKQRQTEASASFSTNATEKRVQLFNTYQKQNMQIDIVDLMENQTPTGTKVIILIPLH